MTGKVGRPKMPNKKRIISPKIHPDAIAAYKKLNAHQRGLSVKIIENALIKAAKTLEKSIKK